MPTQLQLLQQPQQRRALHHKELIMEICTVDEYNAPVDHRAIIANIRTSALAAGWTVEEYRTADEVWRTSIGWEAGTYQQPSDLGKPSYAGSIGTGYNGIFLQLQGVGFGAQGAYNRYRLYGFKTDNYVVSWTKRSAWDWYSTPRGVTSVLSFGWPTQQTYDADGYYHPARQDSKAPPISSYDPNAWTGENIDIPYHQLTFPLPCIKQWVITYGTKLIHSIVNIDNVFTSHLMMGIVDLFDQSHPYGQFYQLSNTHSMLNQEDPHWSQYATYARGLMSPMVLADGTYGMVTGNSILSQLNSSRLSPLSGINYGDYYDSIILQNTWSGKRVIHTPILSVQISGLIKPVGRMWYGILNVENLVPGTILTYGSEQYQVWPVYSTTYPNTYGLAYRIS